MPSSLVGAGLFLLSFQFGVLSFSVAARTWETHHSWAELRMADPEIYQSYAAVYDAIGQARLGVQLAAWVLTWLRAQGEVPRRVLDVACGTGAAAQVFAAAGCAVVGVDRARPMLEIARGRARDANQAITFVERDIRELAPSATTHGAESDADNADMWAIVGQPASFELATCFYDSLNYLTADGDLDGVMGGVAAALRPGGWFIFDLNTEAVFQAYHERDIVTYDGPDMLVYNQIHYQHHTRLAEGRIVWFVRELDRWWRGEETHTERAWTETEVRAALAAAGLNMVAQLAPGGTPVTEESYRAIYIAQKGQA